MSDIVSNHHGLAPLDDAKLITKLMVDTTSLEIPLQSNIGKEAWVAVAELSRLYTTGMDTKSTVAEGLDLGIHVGVRGSQDKEKKLNFFVLGPLEELLEFACPGCVDRHVLGRGLDHRLVDLQAHVVHEADKLVNHVALDRSVKSLRNIDKGPALNHVPGPVDLDVPKVPGGAIRTNLCWLQRLCVEVRNPRRRKHTSLNSQKLLVDMDTEFGLLLLADDAKTPCRVHTSMPSSRPSVSRASVEMERAFA